MSRLLFSRRDTARCVRLPHPARILLFSRRDTARCVRLPHPAGILLFLLLSSFILHPSSFSFAFTHYSTFRADTASSNTVKLIRTGKVFSDGTDVYTMTWNATTGNYEATLDDATFVPDYYRIEDGTGNIVIKYFFLPNKLTDSDNVEDDFLRNDGDDQMVGEFECKPAAATDTKFRVGDETDSSITVSASNDAESADRILYLNVSSFRFTSATKITTLSPGTAAADAVNFAQVDSTRGSGFVQATENCHALGLRLSAIECPDTFTTAAACTLTASGYSGGIALSWAMNAADDTSVCRYELYRSRTALPGHAKGELNSTQLANLRSRMNRVNLAGRTDNTADIPTLADWYFIALAFDGDIPSECFASTQIYGETGVSIDITTPIIGGAASLTAAITTLAEKVNALDDALGGGGVPKVLFCQNEYAATDTGTAPVLSQWIDSTAVKLVKVRGTLYRDEVYNLLRIRCKIKTAFAGSAATLILNAGGLATEITSTATTYETRTFSLDLSSLDDGLYEWYLELKAGTSGGTKRATVTDVIVELLAQ